MHTRAIQRLIAVALVGFLALPALGQSSRDASATKQIDEAINNHYLMMELDKAERQLTEVVNSCADQCSASLKARAWMYVGVVRGSGKNDLAGASEAFTTALSLDSSVQLDREISSTETQTTFDALAGTSGQSTATSRVTTSVPSGEIPGDIVCTPDTGSEILTRMPIPISCTTDADATSAVLKFKEFGSNDWKKLDLVKRGNAFEGTIPCSVTGSAGPLLWFVGAKNSADEYVDQFGSKKNPATFDLVSGGGIDLSYPDGSAASRCADASDCPPNFPGCASSNDSCGELDWGAACKNSTECKCGLACDGGTCVNAASCSTDEECSSGVCTNGYCASASEAAGPFKRHWVELSFAMDFPNFGGGDLCISPNKNDYSVYCYDANGNEGPAAGLRDVNTGFNLSQYRVLLGYDYALTDKIQAGARVGYIIGGNSTQFLPIHAELRGTYNFTSLAKKGLRPSIYVGVGLGDMDWVFLGVPSNSGPIDVYKRGGNLFANGGVGLGYAFTPELVLKVGVGAVVAFPTFSFGLQPNFAFQVGF